MRFMLESTSKQTEKREKKMCDMYKKEKKNCIVLIKHKEKEYIISIH
jgi:hypothetical protein